MPRLRKASRLLLWISPRRYPLLPIRVMRSRWKGLRTRQIWVYAPPFTWGARTPTGWLVSWATFGIKVLYFVSRSSELVQIVVMAHLDLHRLLWKMMAAFLSSFSRLVGRWVGGCADGMVWRGVRGGIRSGWGVFLDVFDRSRFERGGFVWIWQQWHQVKQSKSQDPSLCASYALVSVCWIEILREENPHHSA